MDKIKGEGGGRKLYLNNNKKQNKTMVHLHNGILFSRKKEGAPTLHNSMDGTGEHYTK